MYVDADDGYVNVSSATITVNVSTISISLSSCLDSFVVKPTAANSTGIAPTGQSTAGCSYNVTNNETVAVNFELKYIGSLAYFAEYNLQTFENIYGDFTTAETTWVNTTYDWTRLCFDAQSYSTLSNQGLYSMRARYRFNNTEDAQRDYYNGSDWLLVNTTFGCLQNNYIAFNTTNSNYSRYDSAFFSYRSSTADINETVNLWLNITSNNNSVQTSMISVYNVSNWTTATLSLDGLNTSGITEYRFIFNGTENGEMYIDNLWLNDTEGETKLVFYGGNQTYNVSTALSSSYQNIFTIPANSTMPLKFWFDFNFPMLGIDLDLSDLWYRGTI